MAHLESGSILNFIDYINSKNITVSFNIDNEFVVPSVSTNSSSDTFELDMHIVVPTMQPIVIISSMLDSLKQAWIQYVALLIPVMYVVWGIILRKAYLAKVLDATVRSEVREKT